MLRALPSCSHFMTADKLVTASTNWFELTPFLLVLFFVRSASRVSFFSWSLASSVSSNTCLCLCGWNLYPDTSASVK